MGFVVFLKKAVPKVLDRKPDQAVLAELNGRLSDEVHASIVYMVQAHMFEAQGHLALAKVVKAQAIGEMRHAEGLIERILFYGETPKIVLPKFEYGSSVEDVLGVIGKLENQAIGRYNAAAKISAKAGDHVSRDLFASRAKDEEDHLDWLAAQRDRIKAVGIENYLAVLGGEGEPSEGG